MTENDKMEFIIYMIHACADRWNIKPSRAYKMIKQSGCLDDYLIPDYDILHTQSTDYVAHDIEQYLKSRKA